MPPKTRILLQQNNQLKKLFFILPLEDGSISFGSSLPKPKELKIGTVTIPEGEKGSCRVNFKDANNVEPAATHFSYHPSSRSDSGTMQLKTDKNDYLMKYRISRLGDMKDFRRIFSVIPMNPDTFSLLDKEKSKNDIAIPIDGFMGKPFCVDVFLCKKDYDWKRLLVRDALNIAVGICENRDYTLIIELYQKAQFKAWPTYNVFMPFVDGVNIDIDSQT